MVDQGELTRLNELRFEGARRLLTDHRTGPWLLGVTARETPPAIRQALAARLAALAVGDDAVAAVVLLAILLATGIEDDDQPEEARPSC